MNGHRDWGGPSEDHQPVTYWRGYGIYAAHLVVIVYCAFMVVAALAGGSISSLIRGLSFISERVLSGEVWRLVTYGLFNYPSLDFAFSMLILWWCGRELERSFGRRLFAFLYGGIYLVPTVVLTLIGLVKPTAFAGQPGALALFVGFATHFPGMPVFFTLAAKWAAFVLVGIFTLIGLAARDWNALILLWSTCGYAHFFVRVQQGSFTFPTLALWSRKPKLRVLPDLPAKKPVIVKAPAEDATMAEVDALLDKIAKTGMSSLTPRERAKLEAAREGLMKRAAGRG